MGNVTKLDTSHKKTNYPKQKLGGTGFQHLEFYHKASAGDLIINFNSLVISDGAASEGFSNPSPVALISANLKGNRGNLAMDSYRGKWVDRENYTIKDNSQIVLKTPAEEGEVFHGVIHNIVRNTTENPDFQTIQASGILAEGQTIFNVGKYFKVNANPLYQIGEIQVFRGNSPVFTLRNVGNAAANILADGNYHEIDSNGGYGNSIEFNDAGAVGGELIVVISTGRLLERPTNSLLQEIETLAGQLSAAIPYVEDLANLAPGTLLAAPNNVDLKSFGDMVLVHERMLDIEVYSKSQSSRLLNTTAFGNVDITGALTASSGSGVYSYDSGTGIYTMLMDGKVDISSSLRASGASSVQPLILVDGVVELATATSLAVGGSRANAASPIHLSIGQTFKIRNALAGTTNENTVVVSAMANQTIRQILGL